MNNWNAVPSDQIIEKTIKNLGANGITAIVVDTNEQAKEKAISFIPKGAEVMDMTSVTLTETGIQKEIAGSGLIAAVKNTLGKLTDAKEKRRLGAAPDYAIGSVHAVTEEGHVVIASNTGSQLPAYAYGAAHVIWVVGAQKIVKNTDEAMKRIYEYVLPLESERAHKAYGVEKSNVSKLLIVNKEVQPDRIRMILIKEDIGF